MGNIARLPTGAKQELGQRSSVSTTGAIVQVGTPDEILYRPACLFVAELTRTRNLLPGRAELAGDGAVVTLDGGAVLRSAVPATGPVVASIRPERIRLSTGSPGANASELGGRMARVKARPSHVEVDIGCRLLLHLGHGEASSLPAVGQQARVQVDAEDVRLHCCAGAEGEAMIVGSIESA